MEAWRVVADEVLVIWWDAASAECPHLIDRFRRGATVRTWRKPDLDVWPEQANTEPLMPLLPERRV